MSDSPGRSAGRGAELRCTVDVGLYHLLARATDPRAECVVLRRTVSTALSDASEVWVEELWTSAIAAHVHPLLAVVRGIAGGARRLVLGEPVAVAGMGPVTGPVVDELAALVDRAGAGVDRLVGFRGTVEVDAGTRTLRHGELLCPPAGVLARPVRSAFRWVVAELGCTADGDPDPEGGPVDEPAIAADALRADLRDARVRDDQQALWRSVAGAQLGRPVDVAAHEAGGGAVVARWPRRTADGTTLLPPDGARTDLDSAAVTFVEGRTLVRYGLDARLDLRAVMEQPVVRAALAAYAAAGGADPGLREAAVAVLAPDDPPRRLAAPDGTTTAWGGTVVVTDCRGVRVGNRLEQYTTTVSTVAPAAGAALLRDHPDLVGSIVRDACRVDGPPRVEIQRSLYDAVCGPAGCHSTDDAIDADPVGGPVRPPAAWTAYPLLAPPDPEWVDRVAAVVGRAVANGVPTEPLRAALHGAMAEPGAVDRALREVRPGAGAAGLRDALLDSALVGQDALTEVVAALEAQVGDATGRVVVEQDTPTGPARVTWCHPRAPYEHLVTGRAQTVLVAAGDVSVHEPAGPQVDLAAFLRDPRVSVAAVVESRTVRVGDEEHRENRIVAAVCPTVDVAELLAHDPDLVDSLIGCASSREHVLLPTDGRGSSRRSPAAGRTLQVRRAGCTPGPPPP